MTIKELQTVIDATKADINFYEVPASSEMGSKNILTSETLSVPLREFMNPANWTHGFIEVGAEQYKTLQNNSTTLLIDVQQNGITQRALVESTAKVYQSADEFVTRISFSLLKGWV